MSEEREDQAGGVGTLEENELPNETKTDDNAADFEAKYKVLQGKYDAEVPRLAERTKLLETMLANLNTQPKQPEGLTETLDPDIDTLRKEYPSIYDGMSKMVSYELNRFNKSMESKFNDINQVSAGRAMQQFQTALDARVSNWRTLNDDPGFLSWLKEKDRFSPYTRHQLLLEAYKNFDLDTVSAFFMGYAEMIKTPDKGRFVAPNTSSKARTSNQSSNGTYTKTEIQKFYNDLALNRLSLTPAEIKIKENEYYNALNEGRVSD